MTTQAGVEKKERDFCQRRPNFDPFSNVDPLLVGFVVFSPDTWLTDCSGDIPDTL
jgi:hypothetical protein